MVAVRCRIVLDIGDICFVPPSAALQQEKIGKKEIKKNEKSLAEDDKTAEREHQGTFGTSSDSNREVLHARVHARTHTHTPTRAHTHHTTPHHTTPHHTTPHHTTPHHTTRARTHARTHSVWGFVCHVSETSKRHLKRQQPQSDAKSDANFAVIVQFLTCHFTVVTFRGRCTALQKLELNLHQTDHQYRCGFQCSYWTWELHMVSRIILQTMNSNQRCRCDRSGPPPVLLEWHTLFRGILSGAMGSGAIGLLRS